MELRIDTFVIRERGRGMKTKERQVEYKRNKKKKVITGDYWDKIG